MTDHRIGTRKEWLTARLELPETEKELTRRSDEVARRRQELPWVRIDKEYQFETDEGPATRTDPFRGRSQLLIYHFMFGPEFGRVQAQTVGCEMHTLMNVAGTMALGAVEVLPDDPAQGRFPINHVRGSTRTRRGRTRAAATQRGNRTSGRRQILPIRPAAAQPVTMGAAVSGPPYGRSS